MYMKGLTVIANYPMTHFEACCLKDLYEVIQQGENATKAACFSGNNQLADALTVSLSTVNRFIAAGLPILEPGINGSPNIFSVGPVFQWLIDNNAQYAYNVKAVEEANRKSDRRLEYPVNYLDGYISFITPDPK
jgi:hypothetical protein